MTRKTSKQSVHYENNPLFIATNGITLIANSARGVALLLIILSILNEVSAIARYRNGTADTSNIEAFSAQWSSNDWILGIVAVFIIGLALLLIVALLNGVASYTAYKISQDNKVSLREALSVSFENIWAFLWLQTIVLAKTIMWSLLFIVPGFIMWYRYSLASVAFFDNRKNLRGNSAIKESLRLTKNAWLTTYASKTILDLLTFGSLSALIAPATNASLYRQLDSLKTEQKPEAHWLSWVVLIFPLILVLILVLILTLLILAFVLQMNSK